MAGNPDITEQTKEYRFGKDGHADPVAAAKKARPWSIRNQIRYLAAQEVSAEETNESAYKLKGKVTRAQRIAMKLLQKADEGDAKAIDTAIENIDGKVAQPNINADLAAIQNMSDEQLADIISRVDTASGSSDGSTGAGEETSSEKD